MSHAPENLIALLDGPDQPGLVARTSGWIFQRGGNILHADQHSDLQAGVFFQRIVWTPKNSASADAEAIDFEGFAAELGMRVTISRQSHLSRIAIFVSKIEHCFHDLIARWRMGDLHGVPVCVVSNHESLREVSEWHGIPFYHIPVSSDDKDGAEAKQLEVLRQHGVELVVMARYMQVLSQKFLDSCGCPVINIHHSFLPAFAGARPYHQAHRRGVKLIGATAHYATAVLDDGPIIEQDVSPVSHRHAVEDLIRKGRDLEKNVLAKAVRAHLERRVLVYGNKTVVFD